MKPPHTFYRALATALQDKKKSPLTTYELFVEAIQLIAASTTLTAEPVVRLPKRYTRSHHEQLVSRLVRDRILKPISLVHVFSVTDAPEEETVAELCCRFDPFCRLSHFSALTFHGFTSENTRQLFLTAPDRQRWTQMRNERMFSDLGMKYLQQDLRLQRPFSNNERFRSSQIHLYETKRFDPADTIADKGLRVGSIAATFLDTIAQPNLCGGVKKVIKLWEQYARQHLYSIIQKIEASGNAIEKVRAGYILDERMGIQEERIHAWTKLAQRGGSRRLDPDAPYMPYWSERWMISINLQ